MRRFTVVLSAVLLAAMLLASCGRSVPANDTLPTKPAQWVASLSPSTSPDDTLSTKLPQASASLSPSKPPGYTPTPLQTFTVSPMQSTARVSPTATARPSALPSKTPKPPTSSPVIYNDIFNLKFADIAGMEFFFASGAGAWSTEVTILPDGTFSGNHYDTDAGVTGPGYPNGTRYFCAFSGKFSSLKKIGDYEYSMKCDSIVQEGVPGEVEIGEEGVRYITSTPYGFDNADEFRLYLPGKKLNQLPEEFMNWAHCQIYIKNDDDVLPCYGLYNVSGEQGFTH